jgi:hypothetical protein
LFTKPKQHVIEIIYGRDKLVGDFNMEEVSLLEILILVNYKGNFARGKICPQIMLPISLGVKFTQIMLPILKSPTNLPLP